MGWSFTVACGWAALNFCAISLRKFAWILELPNCWKVTLTSPLISPAPLLLAADPGEVRLPLWPQAARVAAAPSPAAVRMNSRLRTSLLRDRPGLVPRFGGCRGAPTRSADRRAGQGAGVIRSSRRAPLLDCRMRSTNRRIAERKGCG